MGAGPCLSPMWSHHSPAPGNANATGVGGGLEDIWKSHPALRRKIQVKAKEQPVGMWEGQSEDGEQEVKQ